MDEGFIGPTYILKLVQPNLCAQCRKPITSGAAYALGAPYHCVMHAACAYLFSFDGRWPHQMPAAFYDQVPSTFQQNRQLRTSQDDSVVPYSMPGYNNQRP